MAKAQGKIVDTWFFAPDRDEAEKIQVPVRIYKQTRNEKYRSDGHTRNRPPFETLHVEFQVELSGDKDDDVLIGTDIEALRAAVWARLDSRYAVAWEDYFLVEVEEERPFRGMGAGFSVTYRDVEKGTCWNGRKLMREYSHGWRVQPWPGDFTDREGRVLACIPATKANRRALEEFCKRIDTLREHLRRYLRPENIITTLRRLRDLSALPQVDPKLLDEE